MYKDELFQITYANSTEGASSETLHLMMTDEDAKL